MDKPILFIDNICRKARQGSDGNAYASGESVSVLNDDRRRVFNDATFIDDVASLSDLSGGQIVMETSGNRYDILDISTYTLPTTGLWLAGAWNGSMYVILGNNSSVAVSSPDGNTWTERALPASRLWRAVCWSPTKNIFVAVATGPTDKGAYSYDGITWTEMTLPASRDWISVAWNGSVFCAVASSSTDKCATSADGINWDERTMATTATRIDIAWNGSVFCALDGTQANTSSNGISWTGATMSNQDWESIAANGDGLFCAISQSTTAVTCYSSVSTDGVSWTDYALPADDNPGWTSLVWNGSVFVACNASSGEIITSPDGETWTKQTLPAAITQCGLLIVRNTWVYAFEYGGDNILRSRNGETWYGTNHIDTAQPLADADLEQPYTIELGLASPSASATVPAYYMADNVLSPVAKGVENTQWKVRFHLPNLIRDGSFESGAFSPNWTAGANWSTGTTNWLEGTYYAAWDLGASNHLTQTSTKKLEKGKTYRMVYEAIAVTAAPTAGAVTIQVRQSGSDADIGSDITGAQPSILTLADWYEMEFTADFDTDDWYLKFLTDHTKANGCTKVKIDEIYLYEKPTVDSLIIGRHNLNGLTGITLYSWKLSPLRSTAAVGTDDCTELHTFDVEGTGTIYHGVTASNDPVYELIIPAASGFTPEIGEIFLGTGWSLPRHVKAPFDPWATNAQNLREVRLRCEHIPPSYRTAQIEQLFDALRNNESVWWKWDTDAPILMRSPNAGREAPFSPYAVGLDLTLEEVV